MKSFGLLRRLAAAPVAGTVLSIVLPVETQAQSAAEEHFACYVPDLGVVYRIRDGGSLLEDCRDPSHVEFSWTTLSDGSVSTNLLADGAVTTDKLADGSVNNSKLANDAVASGNIVDGSVAASDLASEVLAGLGLFSFNNIGSASSITTTPRDLGSVTIDAPRTGNVLLMVTGQAIFFGDQTTVNIALATTAGGSDLASTRVGRLDGSGGLRYALGFSDMVIVPVTAGTRSFFASAFLSEAFSANTVNLADVRLTAIFIPTL